MYRLIQIEPDDAAHEAVVEVLAHSPLPFTVERSPDLEAAAAIAVDRPVDAVLIGLPRQAGAIDAIGRCRTILGARPLIVLTETADLAFAREVLRAGAQDIVVKDERALAVLSRILLYAIERAGAEARHKDLEVEARASSALLDALFATSSEGLVQLDASGTIARASAKARQLLGLATPPPSGCRLTARMQRDAAARLTAMLEGETPLGEARSATFAFSIDGTTRLLEVQALPLDLETSDPPHLLVLAEVQAAFADESPDASANADRRPDAGRITAVVASPAVKLVVPDRPPTAAPPTAAPPSAAPPTVAPRSAAPMAAATRPLALIEALDRTAKWRVVHSTAADAGEDAGWGFLLPDPKSAATLARLTAVSRDDPDVALAIDRLQLRAWRKLAIHAPDQLPARAALEVGYVTCASRPHLQHFLGKAGTLPGGLFERWCPVLAHVPKGVYVPTLAKTIRALAAGRGRPAVQLPELDAAFRELAFGQLELLILDLGQLKAALAKDNKAVTTLLTQAEQEGCRTLVRGASGPLAEALRSRLGIDLTVEG